MGQEPQHPVRTEFRLVNPRFVNLTDQIENMEQEIFELKNLCDALDLAVDEVECLVIGGDLHARKRVSALLGIRYALCSKVENLQSML